MNCNESSSFNACGIFLSLVFLPFGAVVCAQLNDNTHIIIRHILQLSYILNSDIFSFILLCSAFYVQSIDYINLISYTNGTNH
jgi:hypothetical protein